MPQKEFDLIVAAEQKGQRLDCFVCSVAGLSISRSQGKKLIEEKHVTVNNAPSQPSYRLKRDDRVKIVVPPPKELAAKPENIPLKIVFEDDDIIVVDKPKGMVTHPAPANQSGTLVNALLFHTHLAALGAPLRPGIIHRLDKDTSGLVVAAKNDAAYRSLVLQMKNRTVDKTYVALVHGVMKNNEGTIEAKMGRHPVHRKKMAVLKSAKGKEAATCYRVLKRFGSYTLVEVKIKTGRTHQIRVHLSHIGYPVVGDGTYGKSKNEWGITGQLLHAKELAFNHPKSGKKMVFEVEMPQEMSEVIQQMA